MQLKYNNFLQFLSHGTFLTWGLLKDDENHDTEQKHLVIGN